MKRKAPLKIPGCPFAFLDNTTLAYRQQLLFLRVAQINTPEIIMRQNRGQFGRFGGL
jgi:hypothetical protein